MSPKTVLWYLTLVVKVKTKVKDRKTILNGYSGLITRTSITDHHHHVFVWQKVDRPQPRHHTSQ